MSEYVCCRNISADHQYNFLSAVERNVLLEEFVSDVIFVTFGPGNAGSSR